MKDAPHSNPRLIYVFHAAALLGTVAIGLTLWAWGQPLISMSGEVRLWVHRIWSSENSQQIADWYTLSHIVHGLLVALIGKLVIHRTGFLLIYAVAIGTGIAWELIEHSAWVMAHFRTVTLYRGYFGDSVLNAVMDYVFMMAGFFVGLWLPTLGTAALILVLELTATMVARDCLLLTTIRIIYPIEALDEWRDEIDPKKNSN